MGPGLFDLPNLEVVYDVSRTKFASFAQDRQVRLGQSNLLTGKGRGPVSESGRANNSDYAVQRPHLRGYTNVVLAPVHILR